jgi:hypothetical protein
LAVQSNRVYLTPCIAVPSVSFRAASDKRCSLSLMNTIRAFAACIAFAIGALLLLFGCLYEFGPSSADQTVEHNKQLDKSFKTAAQHIEYFKSEHRRPPTDAEFNTWASGFPLVPYSNPNGMQLSYSSFADEAIKMFGPPVAGGYLLVYWRGEWFEYYASWAKRSSLEFDESKYYALGIKYADGGVLFVFSALLILVGRKMWANPSFKRTRLRPSA